MTNLGIFLRKLIFVSFFTAFATLISAAVDIRQFSEREGLPNRQVYGLQADHNGFVWIYTLSGIGRYDGREFRHYRLNDVDLSRDNIQSATSLSLTPDGQLCISLKSGQVFVYNPTLDHFEKVFDFRDHKLNGVRIYNVLFINNAMALCTSDGIYTVVGDEVLRQALPGKTVHDLMNADSTTWFASADDGIYKIIVDPSGNSKPIASIIAGSENKNFRSMEISGNKIFVGSFANGIYVIDRATDTARRLSSVAPNMPVNIIARDNDNTMLVGIDGAGVYRIDPETESVIKHYAYNGTFSGLSANTISDICTDNDGGLWISTSTHGINYIPQTVTAVTATIHEARNPNSIASDYVITMFEDADGDLWYGTDSGVSMKNRAGQWRHFLKSPDGSDNSILTITQSNDGTIWAGGYGSGAWRINKITGSAERMPNREGNRGVGTKYIFEIFADGDDIWFGGIEGDITRYDSTDDSYHYYPAECVGDIDYGPDKRLYMAGCGGIGIYDRHNDTINWIHTIGDLEIKHPTRYLLYDNKREEMWFASDGEGIIRYFPNSGKAERIDTAGKVNSSSIDGIIQDSTGKIWFITEYDIYYIDPDTNAVNRITSALGLEKTSFLPGAITLRSDGMLEFGTTDGAIAIDPLQDFGEIKAPRLIFTDLFVNQERVIPDPTNKRLEKSIDLVDHIILSHNENSFTISFSSISFANSRRITYQWFLKGYDSELWSSDNVSEAVYRKIPPGHYIFSLYAIDSLTDEVLAERSIEIIVRPPLWLTWWAKTLYVILILLAGWIIYKFVRRRQHERRVTDKLQSFLNLVHDLRTPVTLIKAPLSEIETQSDLPDDTKKNVHLAMTNVERLLSMISRLLDLRRESQHSDCLNLAETNVKDYLNSKAAEYRVAAMHKGLSLNVSVPDDMPTVMMDCNKISHILDNLLSNAIKYTFSGSVELRAQCDKKHWYLEISDSGIGIPRRDHSRLFQNQYRGANAIATDEIGSGMGLLIVHRLCALHKGKIKVISKEDQGTTFLLSFPLSIRVPARKIPAMAIETEQQPTDNANDNGKETVVLIDDDKDIRDYLADALSSTYNIFRFGDATEALQQISTINPDIVISDVRLQGVSGFELCQKLKGSVETSHIPVILLSALGERQNIILGLEAGANDYVVKPFDISVLRLRIRNILNSRRQLRSSFIDDTTQTPETPLISELDREFMDKVRNVLDENIADSEYSIADLCRDLGMSRTTIYNKIKALSGESINEFMRIRRLNKAKDLLTTRRYSISEVAYMVGFSDPKYFSTCFKKQFGMSPSKI